MLVFFLKNRLNMQVQSLLHVLCDETKLAELDLKVCHCPLNIHSCVSASSTLRALLATQVYL